MGKKSEYHFNFEDLKVYQKAMEFGEIINVQIKSFPKEEMFNLTSQFKRASDAIALTIAEGSSDTNANFKRYLKMSWGSCRECVSVSTKARLRGYISFETDEINRGYLTEISKMLVALMKYLGDKE